LVKIIAFIFLFIAFVGYTIIVYTKGTTKDKKYSLAEQKQINKGKELFQKHNCSSCHQLYGLGGYLGPELTTAWSDKHRGEAYMKVFLKAGGLRMPKYNFNEEEINSIISYLRYVDSTASTYKQ
jgi:nitric oxide reductase subunit C